MSRTAATTASRAEEFSVALTVGLGVSLGMAFGLLGGALLVAKDALLPRLVIYDPHLFWMAPLAHAVWALPAGLLLGLLHHVRPRLFTPQLIVFLLVAGGCYAVLRVYAYELTDWAVAILSAGLAYRAARWRRLTEAGRARAFLRRGAAPLAAAPALLAAVALAGPAVREQLRLVGRPEPLPGAPNVLLIILDTVRAMSMGLYGHERPITPRIDGIAQRGVVFDLAIAPAPWTLPTHASIFTGRFPHELNATWRTPLDEEHPTLAEALAAPGYRTGAVVGNLFNANSEMGLGRGFDRYIDYTATWGGFIDAAYPGRLVLGHIRDRWFRRDFEFSDFQQRRTAREISRDLLRWIDGARGRPFFAFVNFFDAHDPYMAPDSYEVAIARMPLRNRPPVRTLKHGELTASDPERERSIHLALDRYEAALAYLDAEVGRLIDALDARGLLENTLLIITADHGEEFGEHGVSWHGHSLYMPALHVPLVMVWPGRIPAGLRIPEAVSLRDIPATILHGIGTASPAGGDAEGAPRLPGRPLSRFWRPSPDAPQPAPVVSSLDLDLDGIERWPGSRRLESIVLAGMHYIHNEAGPEELYDLAADPLEATNLAGTSAATLEPYRQALLQAGAPLVTAALAGSNPARPSPSGSKLGSGPP